MTEATFEKFKDRPNTLLIKRIMEANGLSKEDLAVILDVTPGYLNNKIARGSFSIRDLVLILFGTGEAYEFSEEDLRIFKCFI